MRTYTFTSKVINVQDYIDRLNQTFKDAGLINLAGYWEVSSSSIATTFYWKEYPTKLVHIRVDTLRDFEGKINRLNREKSTGVKEEVQRDIFQVGEEVVYNLDIVVLQ